MKKFLISFFIFLTLVFFLSSSVKDTSAQFYLQTDRVIVSFRPLVPQFLKESIVRKEGLLLDEKLKLKDTYVIKVPAARREVIINALNRNLLIAFAEQDAEAQALEVPNDPRFPDQWGLQKISAPDAWDLTKGSEDIDIAVVTDDPKVVIEHFVKFPKLSKIIEKGDK